MFDVERLHSIRTAPLQRFWTYVYKFHTDSNTLTCYFVYIKMLKPCFPRSRNIIHYLRLFWAREVQQLESSASASLGCYSPSIDCLYSQSHRCPNEIDTQKITRMYLRLHFVACYTKRLSKTISVHRRHDWNKTSTMKMKCNCFRNKSYPMRTYFIYFDNVEPPWNRMIADTELDQI